MTRADAELEIAQLAKDETDILIWCPRTHPLSLRFHFSCRFSLRVEVGHRVCVFSLAEVQAEKVTYKDMLRKVRRQMPKHPVFELEISDDEDSTNDITERY